MTIASTVSLILEVELDTLVFKRRLISVPAGTWTAKLGAASNKNVATWRRRPRKDRAGEREELAKFGRAKAPARDGGISEFCKFLKKPGPTCASFFVPLRGWRAGKHSFLRRPDSSRRSCPARKTTLLTAFHQLGYCTIDILNANPKCL